MSNYCGVLRNKTDLKEGLNKLQSIKYKLSDLKVDINSSDVNDLISALNLKSSLISAEATLISALARQESRGAHQRQDFKKLSTLENKNYYVKEKNGKLIVTSKKVNPLNEEIANFFSKTTELKNLENKLLE